MPTYETLFITSPQLTDDEELTTVETFAQIVTDGGGEFHAKDRMGRRRLAYTIQRCEDGTYTRFLYDSAAAVPRELERRIRLSDKVLRSLTVRLEPDWAKEAKEQAKRDAEQRAQMAAAGLNPDAPDAAPRPADDDGGDSGAMERGDDERG
ncbi:MAG TPA: 30S ribosomal protein S6 [Candidatus Polarisedimenticolaceae bacterium]|nr:30S ribosomal protein S6 [Candidatus Polarisedimenticolaceae bacterium]